jgi:hypothetical protein
MVDHDTYLILRRIIIVGINYFEITNLEIFTTL